MVSEITRRYFAGRNVSESSFGRCRLLTTDRWSRDERSPWLRRVSRIVLKPARQSGQQRSSCPKAAKVSKCSRHGSRFDSPNYYLLVRFNGLLTR